MAEGAEGARERVTEGARVREIDGARERVTDGPRECAGEGATVVEVGDDTIVAGEGRGEDRSFELR